MTIRLPRIGSFAGPDAEPYLEVICKLNLSAYKIRDTEAVLTVHEGPLANKKYKIIIVASELSKMHKDFDKLKLVKWLG